MGLPDCSLFPRDLILHVACGVSFVKASLMMMQLLMMLFLQSFPLDPHHQPPCLKMWLRWTGNTYVLSHSTARFPPEHLSVVLCLLYLLCWLYLLSNTHHPLLNQSQGEVSPLHFYCAMHISHRITHTLSIWQSLVTHDIKFMIKMSKIFISQSY